METMEAIAKRRSIRKFTDAPVSDAIIGDLLRAAALAPSGKNRQPWRFVVVRGDKRAEMVRVMRAGMETEKPHGDDLGSSPWTLAVMERAPVTVFVFNDELTNDDQPYGLRDLIGNSVDIQSIGAAIQNLLLAAQDKGLGTLWICDVFYAYKGLCAWLGETRQLVAAVSIGFPAEEPTARPRKNIDEITRWL